jgi:hypothetical protein
MLIILFLFVALLVYLGFVNNRPTPILIPAESIALSAEVAKNLSGTAIPEYVLTYGMSLVIALLFFFGG